MSCCEKGEDDPWGLLQRLHNEFVLKASDVYVGEPLWLKVKDALVFHDHDHKAWWCPHITRLWNGWIFVGSDSDQKMTHETCSDWNFCRECGTPRPGTDPDARWRREAMMPSLSGQGC